MKIKMFYCNEMNYLAINSWLTIAGTVKWSLTVTWAENIRMNEVKILNLVS